MKKSILLLIIAVFITGLFAVPREMVIVEIATGTWCPYCPGAAMGAHDLLENGHNVAVIKNHGGDSYENAYSSARNNYYGISSYPTAKFDGVLEYSDGSQTQSLYSTYLSRVNQRLAIPSNYTISAEADVNGNIMTVDVTVTKVSDDANTNVKLRSSITQSNIAHNWIGQTTVDNVNRLMAPNASGVAINLATGESVTETLVFNLDSNWPIPDLELVLFVQTDTSKEILQGKKYNIAGLTGAFPASTQSIMFDGIFVGGIQPVPVTFYNYFDTTVNATLTSSSEHFTVEHTEITIPASQTFTMDISFTPQAAGDFTGTIDVVGNFNIHPEFSIDLSGSSFTNEPPIAENLVISGAPIAYETLTASYDYSDPDQDPQGETEFVWYIYSNGSQHALDDEDGPTCYVQNHYIGMQLVVSVTPYDIHGMPGETVFSEPSEVIQNIPAPENLAAELVPPSTVVLTWEKPSAYRDRAISGYKLFRNGLNIATISNINTLTFTDTWVPDGTHEYWICSHHQNPVAMSDPSPSVFIEVGETSNEDAVSTVQFGITSSPNPFADAMSFSAKSLPASDVNITIFNLRGQQVNAFTAKADINGEANLDWNGKDKNGKNLESGVYLYKMESSGKTFTGKIIKTK